MIAGLAMSGLSPAAADPVADRGGAEAAAAGSAATAHDGRTEATAAASCWEIKQNDPGSPDGTYWLQTPAMHAPGQFFCDQSTDGGGWVMIGRGREGWQTHTQGWGDQSLLQTRDRSGKNVKVAQLPSETVNGLLNNQPVSDLSDGYRVVRAADAQGSRWQTLNIKPRQTKGWVWPFKSYTTYDYRFDKDPWAGARQTMDQPLNNNCNWYNSCTTSLEVRSLSANKYEMGWSYASNASIGNGTFVQQLKGGGNRIPFAEVYVRPQVSSTDSGFAAISDSGTAAIPSRTDKVASEYARRTSWGVSGNLTGSVAEGSIQVQAFAQLGDTMFVGGNFTGVQKGSSGQVHSSKALAAFDASTGEWKSSLTFDFNSQVHDLMALPNGKLLVAGDFTTVNGKAHSGTVVIDPATGNVDESWDLQIVNRLSKGVLTVKTLATDGTNIYLGGAFTHLSGQGVTNSYGRAAARVSLSGRPDRSWNPEFNGSVWGSAVDSATGKYFAGGYFSMSQKTPVKWAASILTNPGAQVDSAFSFVGSVTTDFYKYKYPKKQYQQAVNTVDGNVYFGGSEHNLFRYDTATMTRRSGSITLANGGDIQAIKSSNGVTYASCHCSDFSYENAYSWDNLPAENWTEADPIRWVGAWDSATGKQLDWTPYNLSSLRSTGAWALEVTKAGTLWVGGDFTNSYTSLSNRQWNGGFALYDARDNEPTAAPARPSITSSGTDKVNLSWNAVSGAKKYEVLRDDRTIATTTKTSVTVPLGGAQRYFVRTVDDNGNVSASSPVATAPGSKAVTDRPAGVSEPDSQDLDGIGPDADLADAENGDLADQESADDSTEQATGPSAGPASGAPLAPVDATNDTGEVIPAGSEWSYRSEATAADEDWSKHADLGRWLTGRAPFGWDSGNSMINTPLKKSVVRTAYFSRDINLGELTDSTKLTLKARVDDGAVIRVNGTEVGRLRMESRDVDHDGKPDNVISFTDSATQAVTTAEASADENMFTMELDRSQLTDGINRISVETHAAADSDHQSTSSLTFDATATLER